jgi:hypothetical protein
MLSDWALSFARAAGARLGLLEHRTAIHDAHLERPGEGRNLKREDEEKHRRENLFHLCSPSMDWDRTDWDELRSPAKVVP